MGTTILHTADTHIGYRQYHKPEREEDFRAAFESVIDAAIERNVDAVVHAGDIFNRSRPSIEALLDCIEQLKRLRQHNIGFHTIVGNHDGTRTREWPEFFERLDLGNYIGYHGDVIGDGDVVLYGQDFVERGQREQVSYEFSTQDADTAFFVGHGLFTPFPHGDWNTEEILAKSPVAFDGLLVGDNHKPMVERIGGVPITYPGSTERTAADQTAKRGYNIITVEAGSVTVSHETIDTRQFQFIDVELSANDGVERVVDAVESHTIADGAVVVVTITGEGSRVSSGKVEDTGIQAGALAVRVSDRREFEESEAEFQDVSFGDPDEAVRKRKGDLGLSSLGSEFEQLARDVEGEAQTVLKETSEQRTTDLLEREGASALVDGGEKTDAEIDRDSEDGDPNTQPTADSATEHTAVDDSSTAGSAPADEERTRQGGSVESSSAPDTPDDSAGEQSDTDEQSGMASTDDDDSDDGSAPKQLQFDELD